MTSQEPRDLLVQVRGGPSPLYELEDPQAYADLGAFTRNVALDDERLGLPTHLADALRSWSRSRPSAGFTSRPELRKHVEQGLVLARRLAEQLGPLRPVRYWDERHRTAKWVCWTCDRLHWERCGHGTPAYPVDLTVEGEFAYGPLRSDGFGDFFPDDPAAGLDLSDSLVADLYTWARSIDTTLNLDLRDREDGKYDDERGRLFGEGMELARRVAQEVGPDRTVTYKGLANGGLDKLTVIRWQGVRQL
ncbi:hypothetical protein ACFV0T_36905 [Streptomyces sp. NPDC059582]|uniref:hypothetical protein n=1 Tax=Streptomyces sp. NPDC059582 TaxID=3346875 RepID=UPI003679A02A